MSNRIPLIAVVIASTVATVVPFSASAYDSNDGDLRGTSAALDMPRQPDGWIRKPHRRWVGKDVYNSDGTNQQRTASAMPGSTVRFRIALQNDSSEAVAMRGVAFPQTTIGYSVRYFQGTTEIALVQGSFQTPVLQPGEWVTFRAEIAVSASAATNSSVSHLIQFVPVGPHSDSELDSVKFTVKRI